MATDYEPMNIDPPISTPTSQHEHDPQIDWVPPPTLGESDIYKVHIVPGGCWVEYKWKTAEQCPTARIEPFYSRFPPSRTSAETCDWIYVDRGRPSGTAPLEHKDSDVEGLQRDFLELITTLEATGERVTPGHIDVLARKHNVLSGKWLIYTKSTQIDRLWRRVVRAVCFDRGRGIVKVSTRKSEDDTHTICVYVDDYTNTGDVDELRSALRAAGVHWRIGFKTDAYTYLGIYRANPWGLRPCLYYDAERHN